MLLRGSGVSGGKFRIYEQFLKQEGTKKNAAFLKEKYGTGGAYPAIPDRKLDEWHDSKGIQISVGSAMQPDAQLTLSWGEAAKRIGELINADRYLNRAEKEHYPAYRAQEEQRKARWKIAAEIRSVIDDYVDFKTQLGETGQCEKVLFAKGCADSFGMGEKKCYVRTSEGSFVLPTLRSAMQTIIGDNTHLTERCEALLTQLSGPLAAPLEPTADETNPPPPPKKEYRLSLGDAVYLGTQVSKLNRIFERMGYPAPKRRVIERKKGQARHPSENSLGMRGHGAREMGQVLSEQTQRPSVRATLAALKAIAQRAAQAQEQAIETTAKEGRE